MAAADTAASAVYDGFFPLKDSPEIGGGGGEIYIYHGLCLSLVAKAHTAANAVYDGFSTKHSQNGEEGERGGNHGLCLHLVAEAHSTAKAQI